MADDAKSHPDTQAELAELRERIRQLELERDTLKQAAVERSHTENQLKSSQVALQRLIRQIPIGIQVFDNCGLCTDVNDAHLEIFGVLRDDLVGVYNIFEDSLADQMATSIAARRALKGETIELGDLEFNFTNANPRYADVHQTQKTVNVTLLPIFDHEQNVASFVGMNMDVTLRKTAENHLRINEQRYRAIVEDQNEMVCRYLPDGTLTFVNQAYCQFYGLTHDELIGTKWQTLMTEQYLSRVQSTVDQLSPEAPSNYAEYQLQDDLGKSRWIHWINHAFFDQNNQILEYQGIGIDVTEKKLIEQKQFDVALERERTRILSEFVVQAAHEFRTPLSIINSSAYAMTRQADARQREERLEKISRQVDLITRLIDSMTLMSRLDSNVAEDEHVVANLNQLLDIVYLRSKSAFEAKGMTCTLIPYEYPLIVQVKQKDFVRAVESIFENVLKYSGENEAIVVKSYQENDLAVINITDSGEGIDEAVLPHIFERFYRQDKSGKTPGLGLGLPIAKALLRQYGGTIDVHSEVGIGTTFIIKLKLAAPMQQ